MTVRPAPGLSRAVSTFASALPRTRAGRWAAVAVAVTLTAWAAIILSVDLPPPTGPLLVVTAHVTTTVAAIVALLSRRGNAGNRNVRAASATMAAALGIGVITGFLSAIWYQDTGSATAPVSWQLADTIYMAIIPLLAAALLMLPTSKHLPGSLPTTALDGVMAGLGLWLTLYLLWLQPLHQAGHLPDATLAKTFAYPAADALLIGIATSVAARAAPQWRTKLLLLTAGMMFWSVSDIAYVVTNATDGYRPDSWIGVVGEVGLLIVTAGALVGPTRHQWPAWAGTVSAAAPFVPVIAAWVAMSTVLLSGPVQTNAGAGAWIFVVLGTTVIARLLGGWMDRTRLSVTLDHAGRLHSALGTSSSEIVAVITPDGRVAHTSPPAAAILAANPTLAAAVHPDDLPAARTAFTTTGPGRTHTLNLRLHTADGDYRWHATTLHNRVDDDAVAGMVVNAHDIDHHIVLSEQLAHAATHDPLTGLGNLAAARNQLEAAGPDTTALMVDLDGFKHVNDTYGHSIGDEVLRTAAHRISGCCTGGDTAARIGGDEFLLTTRRNRAEQLADQLCAVLSTPYEVGALHISLSASVGIADLDTSGEDTVRNADLSMYEAKKAGRGHAVRYEPRMHDTSAAAMAAAEALRGALTGTTGAHLGVHYQPIVTLADGKLVAFEALARLTAADGTPIPPDLFIAVAEDSPLIDDLGEHILTTVAADLAAWTAAGIAPKRVCVNVSRRSLNPRLAHRIATMGDTSRLCLEITESAAITDPHASADILAELRTYGVHLALDDFGTGESSLTQLRDLPVDVVKLDKLFAATVGDRQGAAIVTGITDMCTAMGLGVLAEGVETPEAAAALAAAGVRWGQGYLYARPMPGDQATELLAARAGTPAGIPAAPKLQPPAITASAGNSAGR